LFEFLFNEVQDLVNLPLGIEGDTMNKIFINATLQHEKRSVFVCLSI